MKITRFEQIESWQMARKLCGEIYQVSSQKEFSKDYGLKDQTRRASVSIMANIAEGYDSNTNTDFAKFMSYAQRSCSEIQSELYVALDLEYISSEKFTELYELAEETKAKIGGFINPDNS